MAIIKAGFVVFILLFMFVSNVAAQRGYYDAPYKRYEADQSVLSNASITPKSFKQADLQSEASDQICVDLSLPDASAEWTLTEAADGLVIRYSVPDLESGQVGIYADGIKVGTLQLTSKWSWEYLWSNGNPNNNDIINFNPRMRFDEVRIKLLNKIPKDDKLKLVRESGNIHLDFVEMEPVPEPITTPVGAAVYTGDGSTLQSFIDANNGKLIFIPSGKYNVNREIYFGVANTTFQGAGMWYTQINFTNLNAEQGGLKANAVNVNLSDLFLTTEQSSRSNAYKGINGVFTAGSTVRNLWVEHFECGAWIAQNNIGNIAFADGLTVSNCRFRNNYADGINLCKGTRNSIVEHCSFRNNGDDDMAIWSANNLECQNNTFRYNTAENSWRASGCAIYGGYNNKAHHLIIKDNLEAGLRVNNFFPGVGFRDTGMHEFSDITITGCGTFNDLWNSQIGAIDIACNNVAGTKVQNVKFSNIDIVNSKNDAIYIYQWAGDGFYNLIMENININGTGMEYPFNNAGNLNLERGFGILFAASNLKGYGTYCNIIYSGRGGNASTFVNDSNKGIFSWTAVAGCTTGIDERISNLSGKVHTIVFNDNIVQVSGLQSGEVVTVYNIMGAKIFSLISTGDTEIIDSLKNGIYLVAINGTKTYKKVIIRNKE
jgi:hypothetical protein